MLMLSRKYKVFRSAVFYVYIILTVLCASCAMYFSLKGCVEERNSSSFAAVVGGILVWWINKVRRKENLS